MTATTANTRSSVVQVVDDVRDPVARRVADVLRTRSARPRTVVVDDLENIEQAVACGVELDSLYVTRPRKEHTFPTVAEGVAVPRYVLSDRVATSLFADQKRSHVFALAHAPRPARLDDLVGRPGDVVVLDGVRIVGNIGAITRTACALGAAGVVLVDSGLRSVLDRRLIRASRGFVFAMPVVVASRADLARLTRREDLPVATLSADASRPLASIADVAGRLAIVVGSEREGVSAELGGLSAVRYSIPMTPGVDSLNVSVAAGIALYARRAGPAAAGASMPRI